MSDTPTGRICWYELMTTDPDAVFGFYRDVAGWTTAPWEGGADAPPYTMWMNGETPLGGVMRLPEEALAGGAPPHWMMYVSTPDVAGSSERAAELGATVLMGPRELPDVGSISVVQDPQGAVFCLFQPATFTPGHDDPAAVGEMSWHELMTTDWSAACDFYSELLGWERGDLVDMGELGGYQLCHRGAHPIVGVYDKPPEAPCAWLLYVRVADLDAAVEAVRAAGGQVVNGPMEVPGGDRVAQCLDPLGAAFALHQAMQG